MARMSVLALFERRCFDDRNLRHTDSAAAIIRKFVARDARVDLLFAKDEHKSSRYCHRDSYNGAGGLLDLKRIWGIILRM